MHSVIQSTFMKISGKLRQIRYIWNVLRV